MSNFPWERPDDLGSWPFPPRPPLAYVEAIFAAAASGAGKCHVYRGLPTYHPTYWWEWDALWDAASWLCRVRGALRSYVVGEWREGRKALATFPESRSVLP